MREFPFPGTILNGTCSLWALILFCGDVPAIKTKQNKQTVVSDGHDDSTR